MGEVSDEIVLACNNNPCTKKHDCSDCRSCQWCSDNKCSMCLSIKAKIKQKKATQQSSNLSQK